MTIQSHGRFWTLHGAGEVADPEMRMRNSVIRGIVAPGLVWAALTPAAFGQSKLDAGVERTLSEIGNARVLVVMTAPKLGEASSIAYSEPAGFVDDLLGDRGRNVRRIVDLPVVVVETDRRGIADLVDDPHVAYVVADEPVPPLLETSLRTLHVDAVHATGVLGHGYSVAVLDTGVDYDHPFFGGKLRAEGCFSTATSDVHSVRSLCGNGLDVDLTDGAGRNCDLPGCDHGTHVAGIAVGARVSVDGDAISGVAPGAGLMSIQVFTEFDDVRECGADRVPCIRSFPSDQLRALRHVRDLSAAHEIASVNMSFGGGYHNAACDSTNPLTNEILTLRESGILAVVASGNDGYYNATSSPGCISAAMTVGASSRETAALDFSYSNTSAIVDFLAPGTGMTSAIPGGRYGRNTGTSMAAAHVAGLFALLRSRVPSASADEIESAVRATARWTTDPRTGLVLHFPDARGALDTLARSGEQAEPGAGERAPEDVDAAFLAGIAGARRIVVQGGARAAAMPAGEIAERIASALGLDVTARPLGEGTFVAESRAGFSAESLSRLLAALGPDTELYRDDPVSPSAVR